MALLRRKWFFDPAICSLSIPDGGYQSSMTQKRYRFFLFVLLLFLCLSPLFASEPVRIFWVTDNHLKYGDSALEARLEWFIDEVNDKRPDIVIHTGDAIDGKRGRALALKEIDRFAHYWDRIPDSVLSLFVPGNRDIGSAYETTELDWLFLFPSTQETAGSSSTGSLTIKKGMFVYGSSSCVTSPKRWTEPSWTAGLPMPCPRPRSPLCSSWRTVHRCTLLLSDYLKRHRRETNPFISYTATGTGA